VTLPVPEGRQREVVFHPPEGRFVVLGTAGSGKTTMSVHRAAHLGDPATDHSGRTLFVTFNRALIAYLHHLGAGVEPSSTPREGPAPAARSLANTPDATRSGAPGRIARHRQRTSRIWRFSGTSA
jgi:hypothetical protein